MIHVNPNRKGTPKVKRIRISLEDRPANNFFRLCKQYKEKPVQYERSMAIGISNIVTIMDNGFEVTPEDIREVNVTKVESNTDISIEFKRYIGCKLQDNTLLVSDFKNQFPMINPDIPRV